MPKARIHDPRHLAEAAVKVAEANHYLVGIVAEEVDFDVASDAYEILVDMENSGDISHSVADLAFDALQFAHGAALP